MNDITVCIPSIPTRQLYLSRALASVNAQSLKPAAIAVAIDNDRLGAAATRNAALFMAQTEWVAFLDDDDELYPHHLLKLRNHQLETGADVIWPWFDVTPAGATDPFPQHEGRQWDPDDPHSFPITTLVRRSIAVEVGGFPAGDFAAEGGAANEDWLFWNRMSDAGAKFSHLPARTWCWDHDSGNTSGRPDRW